MSQPPSLPWRIGLRLLDRLGDLVAIAILGSLLLVPILLLLGTVDVGTAIQSWIHPEPGAIGLEVSWDEPECGVLVVTNVTETTARALPVRIVEDYTYADAGTYEYEVWIGDLAPGERQVVGYGSGQLVLETDIGALSVWLICERGTAFDHGAWSYAF